MCDDCGNPNHVPAEAPPKLAADIITVAGLDGLVSQIKAKRAEIEAKESEVTVLNKELNGLQGLAVTYLKELGRDDFKSPDGSIRIARKWRVSNPKSDEEKAKLFSWMRDQGIFERFATVNNTSLNSLFMAEWEAAKKKGEGMGFTLPGVPEPTLFEALSYTKGK